MVTYVLDASAQESVVGTIVVVGHGASWVQQSLAELVENKRSLQFVEQTEQLGTGHAVSVALPAINELLNSADGDVLIMPGDTPLLRRATITKLLEQHVNSGAALTVLSAKVAAPTGYGRIVRNETGGVVRIVEEKDATSEERLIDEINTAIMVVKSSLLADALDRVDRQNAQNEYYLTDLVAVLATAGHSVQTYLLEDEMEAAGVNDRVQLASAEAELRRRINEHWMSKGVTMADPASVSIDADVEFEPGSHVLPGTVLKGHCTVGAGASIGPNATLTNVVVGHGAQVASVEGVDAKIGAGAKVGSFAVLTPGAQVADNEIVEPFQLRK